jgi:iron complex outermembrane receptor protein
MDLQRNTADGELTLSQGNWRWHSNLKWRDKVGYGVGVNSALDHSRTGKSNRLTSDLAWNDAAFADNWSVGAQLAWLYYTEQNPSGVGLLPPGARLGPSFFPDGMIGGPNRWERNVRLSAFAIFSGWRNHTVRGGAGHDDLRLTRAETFKNFLISPSGLPIPTGAVIDTNLIQPHIQPQRRSVDYAYVQDEWLLAPDWALTAGVRHDRYADFGPTTNPRVALVWDSSVNLTSKLLLGRAFRAPSFNELYGINPVNSGNASLQPETIRTSELAFVWQASSTFNGNVNLFHYDMANLIRQVVNPAPATGSAYQNVGQATGNGAEVEIQWNPAAALRLSANYARQHAHDHKDGNDPGYAPRHHAYARADWRLAPGMLFSPQLNWVAGRHRAAGDARAPIADYRTLDATWSLQRGAWQWSIMARNITNADAREPSLAPGLALPFDIPTMPRELALRLTLAL